MDDTEDMKEVESLDIMKSVDYGVQDDLVNMEDMKNSIQFVETSQPCSKLLEQ